QASTSRPCLGKHVAGRLRRGHCLGGCPSSDLRRQFSFLCVCATSADLGVAKRGKRERRYSYSDLDLPTSEHRRSQSVKSRRYTKHHVIQVGNFHDL
ncbi:unnamed protein product, partial [Ixodes hexagonus]